MTGCLGSQAEASIDGTLRLARQAWHEQREQEQDDADGDDPTDDHGDRTPFEGRR
ncbi:MAG TPA: hypothetical protein VFA19_07900 [Gaiellaceae bacterium]|nr:hypothetical protein [Gaiellaceae bacterium]